MKQIKILIAVFIFILLVESVYASLFATIGMQGLSMANPKAAEIVNNVICLSNPIVCVQGKIIGMVQGEALNALAKQSPEAAKAISVFNQVKGYVDQGAEIVNELQVDEEGQIFEGIIQFNEKEGEFGNLVGKDIEKREIFGKQIQFEKKEGASTITFTGDNSYVNVRGALFNNINKQDENTPAYLELDEKGYVKEADFTVNEKGGTYTFGNDILYAPPDSRLQYNGKTIKISAPKGSEIKALPQVSSTPNPEFTSNVIEYNGNNLRLPTGNVLNEGSLISDNGKLYLEYSKLDNLKIQGKARLFLDGEQHLDVKENYLSLNANSKKAFIHSNEASGYNLISFYSNNPYIGGEGNSEFVLFQGNKINYDLNIENKENQIPILDFKNLQFEEKESQNALFINGKNGVEIRSLQNSYSLIQVRDNKGSENDIPLVVSFDDENIIGRDKAMLFLGNSDEILLDSKDKINQEFFDITYHQKLLSEGQDTALLPYKDLLKKLEAKSIKISGLSSFSSKETIKALENLENVPERLLYTSGVKEISLNDPQLPESVAGSGGSGRISVDSNPTYGTYIHEIAHIREQSLMKSATEQNINSGTMTDSFTDEFKAYLKQNNIKGIEVEKIANRYTLIRLKVKGMVDEGKLIFDPKTGFSRSLFDYRITAPHNEDMELEHNKLSQVFEEFIKSKNDHYTGQALKNTVDGDWYNVQPTDSYFSQDEIIKLFRENKIKTITPSSQKMMVTSWPGSTAEHEPRNGFIRAYGANNIKEDIATFTEAVYAKPEVFKQQGLLDPKSPNYSPIYQQKLDILLKYGFINQETYDKVVNQ